MSQGGSDTLTALPWARLSSRGPCAALRARSQCLPAVFLDRRIACHGRMSHFRMSCM
jgi:hypothetical protein